MKVTYQLKVNMIVFELIYQDLITRLNIEDWIALGAILSMFATPFIIVAISNLIDLIKASINKRLAVHGLKLR